jgi:NAC domain.
MENKTLSVEEKVAQARLKLAEKFGEASRVGGKGTERRKKKTVHKTQLNDDKKLKTVLKKYNLHPLPEIGEVNMFKDDNTVIQFKNPEGITPIFQILIRL